MSASIFDKFCDNICPYIKKDVEYFLDDSDNEADPQTDPTISRLLFKKVKIENNTVLALTRLHQMWNVEHIHNTRGPIKVYIYQLIRSYYKLYATEDPTLKMETVLLIILHDNHHNNKLPYNKQFAANLSMSILMRNKELYHSKYINYIIWTIQVVAKNYVFYKKNTLITSREEYFPVLLTTWKEEIKPLLFFQLISYQNTQFTIIETDYDRVYVPHYAPNKFSRLSDDVINIILMYLLDNVSQIKQFLQNK